MPAYRLFHIVEISTNSLDEQTVLHFDAAPTVADLIDVLKQHVEREQVDIQVADCDEFDRDHLYDKRDEELRRLTYALEAVERIPATASNENGRLKVGVHSVSAAGVRIGTVLINFHEGYGIA